MRYRWPLLLVAFFATPIALISLATPCSAVPAWSRRYEIPCSSCHAFPSLQLTSVGLNFLQRGHRMEGDSGEKDVGKLLSAHVEWAHAEQVHQATSFESPELHLHAGGALSPLYSVYLDANVNSDFEVIYGQYTRSLTKGGYCTARVGKVIPVILREYAAGLMSSASTPLIVTEATLGQNPFTPTRDSFGADGAAKWKVLFVQAGVVNGDDVAGQALVDGHKDVFASAEINLDNQPTGVGLYYFRGGYDLVADSLATLALDRYDRGAVFANLTQNRFRLAGAYLIGKDHIASQSTEPKMSGFFVQVDAHPNELLAPFVRYDWAKTENAPEEGTVRQATFGVTAAIFSTDVTGGRVSAEFSRREEGTSNTNAGALTLIFAF